MKGHLAIGKCQLNMKMLQAQLHFVVQLLNQIQFLGFSFWQNLSHGNCDQDFFLYSYCNYSSKLGFYGSRGKFKTFFEFIKESLAPVFSLKEDPPTESKQATVELKHTIL